MGIWSAFLQNRASRAPISSPRDVTRPWVDARGVLGRGVGFRRRCSGVRRRGFCGLLGSGRAWSDGGPGALGDVPPRLAGGAVRDLVDCAQVRAACAGVAHPLQSSRTCRAAETWYTGSVADIFRTRCRRRLRSFPVPSGHSVRLDRQVCDSQSPSEMQSWETALRCAAAGADKSVPLPSPPSARPARFSRRQTTCFLACTWDQSISLAWRSGAQESAVPALR